MVGGDRVRGATPAVKDKTPLTRTSQASRPEPPAGRPMSGVVVRIVRGQSHGFIRTTEDREVFFHRSEVTFRVTDDTVSGPRATHVRKKKK